MKIWCERGLMRSLVVILFLSPNSSTSTTHGAAWTTGTGRVKPLSLQTPPSLRRGGTYAFLPSHIALLALQQAAAASSPIPIDASGWPDKFPAKEHCSRCGLCETTMVSRVTDACAFLPRLGMPRLDQLEVAVHGRSRDTNSIHNNNNKSNNAEEARFGVLHAPVRLVRGIRMPGAQWTGSVTSIAVAMLESGQVDAVVCIANAAADGGSDGSSAANASSTSLASAWSEPHPILARTTEEVLRGRGVKPALAPSLRVLDEIRQDATIRKLLFCGVGCAVQAFRAVQDDLGLDQVFVLGTNCVDNSPTPEAAQTFLRDGVKVSNDTTVLGYEFMQDFRVHVKTKEGYIIKPYFSLPGTIAEQSIAKSCLACFDYTNGLADVVVGYMGAPLNGRRMDACDQTLTVRNERGALMVQTAVDAGRLAVGAVALGSGAHEQLAEVTVKSDAIVQAMIGGTVKDQGMPEWFGNIFAALLQMVGPKGISFARYSIDYHILRNYLYLLDQSQPDAAAAVKASLPEYARHIIDHYTEQDQGFRSLERKFLNRTPD